jgi:hypothetical protein
MKLEDTDGTPISGGRPFFAFDAAMFDAVTGIGVFAPTGEAAGAVVDGNRVTIAYVTTTPVTGDYPIMTVSLRIREGAATGSHTQFTLHPSSLWTVAGEVVRPRVSAGTWAAALRSATSFQGTAGSPLERLSRFRVWDSTASRGYASTTSLLPTCGS